MKNLIAAIVAAASLWSVVSANAATVLGNYLAWQYLSEQWDNPNTGEYYFNSKRRQQMAYNQPPAFLQVECYSPNWMVEETCTYSTNSWAAMYESYNYTIWDGAFYIQYTASCTETLFNNWGLARTALVTFTYREVDPATGNMGPWKSQTTATSVPGFSQVNYQFPSVMFKRGAITVEWFRI